MKYGHSSHCKEFDDVDIVSITVMYRTSSDKVSANGLVDKDTFAIQRPYNIISPSKEETSLIRISSYEVTSLGPNSSA